MSLMYLHPPTSSRHRISPVAVALITLGGVLFTVFTPAAAETNCPGDTAIRIPDASLLNDGVNNVLGPFSIELGEGEYDIVVLSTDAHSTTVSAGDQSMEQWYFALDSGYSSPLTTDIADTEDSVFDAWSSQAIAQSTSLTVHHRGEGGVNSVSPECIGFTLVEPAADPAAAQTTRADAPTEANDASSAPIDGVIDTVADDVTRSAPQATFPEQVDQTGDEGPVSALDSISTANELDLVEASNVVEVDGALEAVEGVVEDRLTVDARAQVGPSEAVAIPAVDGVPVLALTGPTAAQKLLLLGLALVTIGAGLIAASGLEDLLDTLDDAKNRRKF